MPDYRSRTRGWRPLTPAQANLLAALACFWMMMFAYFQQYVRGLEPCHLCLLQRGAVIGVGCLSLVAGVHQPRRWGRRVYGGLVSLFGLAGIAVALRQVWVQAQPPGSLPGCGADLQTILSMLPLKAAIGKILEGGGDCQVVTWQFLGLSMAAYVALALTALVGWSLRFNFRR